MKLVTMSWVGAGAIAAAIGGWFLAGPDQKADPKSGPGGTAVVEQPSGKVVAVGKDGAKGGAKDGGKGAKNGAGDPATSAKSVGANSSAGDGSGGSAKSDDTAKGESSGKTENGATTEGSEPDRTAVAGDSSEKTTPSGPNAAVRDSTASEKTGGDDDRIAAIDPARDSEVPAPDADAKTPAPGTAQPVDPNIPAFDLVRIDPDGQTVLAGRAAPNQRVEILLDGKVVETATTDAAGTFVAILQTDLGNTARNLQLRVPAPGGAVSGATTTAGGAGDGTKSATAGTAPESSGAGEGTDKAATADGTKDETAVAAAGAPKDPPASGTTDAAPSGDAEANNNADPIDRADTADTSKPSDGEPKQAAETGTDADGDGEKLAVREGAGAVKASPDGAAATNANDSNTTSAETGSGESERDPATLTDAARTGADDTDVALAPTEADKTPSGGEAPAEPKTTDTAGEAASGDTPADGSRNAKTAGTGDGDGATKGAAAKTEDTSAPEKPASADAAKDTGAGKTTTPGDETAKDVAGADATPKVTEPATPANDTERRDPAALAADDADTTNNAGPSAASDPNAPVRDLPVPTLTGPETGSDTTLSTGGTGERVARASEGTSLSAPDGPKPAPSNDGSVATAPSVPDSAPKRLEPAAPSPTAPDDLSAAPSPEAGSELRAGTEDRPVTGGREVPTTAAETAATGNSPNAPESVTGSQFLTSAPVIILPAADPDKAPTLLSSTPEDLKVLQPSVSDIDSVVLDRITYNDTGDVRLSGRGRPGRAVRVYGNGALISTTNVAKNGNWNLFVDPERGKKIKLLRLDELDSNGNVVTRIEAPFAYSRSSPKEVRQREVVVQKGDMLWRIAEQYYGEGLRYSVIYGANATLIRNPDLIYPGQVFSIPELVDAPAKP